jgi:hypothetical protein
METDRRDAQPRTRYTPGRFTPAVYRDFVAGKPRLSGTRLRDEELLRRAGADLVVTTLDDVDLDALAGGWLERRSR